MNFMMRNKRGSITIFLIAILISALFLNNTLIEIGRYKAVNNILGEIQENAAFSVLANYDRDLFENFGLLGIDAEVDEKQFLKYLQGDTTSEDGSLLEKYVDLEGLDFNGLQANFQKLYFLSQKDVFETQINEFCAYRAPVSLASNALDIEDVLEALIEELEDSMSFLTAFSAVAEQGDTILTAYDKLGDLKEQMESYKESVGNYTEKYNNYQDAVLEVENTWESLNGEEEDRSERMEAGETEIPEIDWSPYYNACEAAANAAMEFQNEISSVKKATVDYWEKFSAFEDAFKAMQEGNISVVLEGAKTNKDSKEIAEEMQKSYKDSENTTNDLLQMFAAFDYQFFEGLRILLDQDATITKANEKKLQVQVKDKIVLTDVQDRTRELLLNNEIEIIRAVIADSWAVAQQAVDDNAPLLNDVVELAEMCVDLSSSGLGTYNAFYIENVSSVEKVNLLDNAVENEYADKDYAYVTDVILSDKAVMTAAELGYQTKALGTTDRYSEFADLEEALNQFSQAADELNDVFRQLKDSNFKLRKLIKSLLQIIQKVINFLGAAIRAVSLLCKNMAANLEKICYSKMFAATYATEMFTNRSSDVDSDKRMNGSDFTNYKGISNGEVFVMANAEYVFAGKSSEEQNQRSAFYAIMGLRLLANIPAVFKDSTVKSMAKAVASVPYVGAVLSVLVYVAVCALESYLDMIFMIYGEDGVYIIKKNLYLSAKGSDELNEQIKGLLGKIKDELEGAEKKAKKKTLSDKIDDWSDGLFRWDYKQHLFLTLCLFVSADKMYAREADLIQMQLDKDKPDKEFRLSDMATYVRTDIKVDYKTLLPVPLQDGIPIRNMYYTGY